MDTKQELTDKIQEKEAQLYRAQRESEAWNKGKNKNSSNAPISKILVESLKKEISELEQKLGAL
ncbi:MAG: hypothetical protein QNK15_00245 [Cycloclasticus sp.]|nr:hypothetical protein [Cycloclasticus sp.]